MTMREHSDIKRFKIESQIRSATSSLAFYTKTEKEYRAHLDSPVTRHMIRWCKVRRKIAMSDLDYYKGQLHAYCKSLR